VVKRDCDLVAGDTSIADHEGGSCQRADSTAKKMTFQEICSSQSRSRVDRCTTVRHAS
ncbi:hypothetical protein KXV85_005054, partial [Aspergillus fumigatus]